MRVALDATEYAVPILPSCLQRIISRTRRTASDGTSNYQFGTSVSVSAISISTSSSNSHSYSAAEKYTASG